MAPLGTRHAPHLPAPARAIGSSAPASGRAPASELRWTASMLWLICLLPSMGLGLLLFDSWLAPVPAGALGVVLLSVIIVPASKLAILRAERRNNRPARR